MYSGSRRIYPSRHLVPDSPKRSDKKPVPLTLPESRARYTEDALLRFGNSVVKKPNISLAKAWPYFTMPDTKDGEPSVIMVDARYEYPTETGELDKTVLTLYWDGKTLRAKQPPVLLYGLDCLWKVLTDTDKQNRLDGKPWGSSVDICFHEGCKSATEARKIKGFVHMGWNGGCKKASYADLSPLNGFSGTVYLYPDDDVKHTKDGGAAPQEETTWEFQAMLTLSSRLTEMGVNAIVVEPLPKAREVKDDGADIVEALEVERPEMIADWIRRNPVVLESRDGFGGGRIRDSEAGGEKIYR